jgi:hypothetical protein
MIASGERRQGANAAKAPVAYLPDLEHPRPPDLPPDLARLRLVKGRASGATWRRLQPVDAEPI